MLELLSRSDKKLIGQLIGIAVVAVLAVVAAGGHAQRVVLESVSSSTSAQTVSFLRDNLSDLSAILVRGRPSAEDLALLRHVSLSGEAFRYKLYNAEGRVAVASRPQDVGKRNTAPYFESILSQGRSFFRVDRRPAEGAFSDALGVPYAEGTDVIGKRYEPIVRDSRLLGVIEIYQDLTALDQRLAAVCRWFLGGLLAILGLIGCACGVSLNRNLQGRRRSIEALEAARRRAESTARQTNRLLEGLVAAEEEKMSRVVGLVAGISHEIGNPLATLSMSLDALESNPCSSGLEGCHARVAHMRDALARVGGFLHGLTALSLENGKMGEGVDVNEIVRSLTSLVHLSDRSRDAAFALKLSPDVASLPLARRSVSLALFIILSAAAESLRGAQGQVAVETRMSGGSDAVELRVAASRGAASGPTRRAFAASPLGSEHPALDTARRIIESLGGKITISGTAAGSDFCDVTLPHTPSFPPQ